MNNEENEVKYVRLKDKENKTYFIQVKVYNFLSRRGLEGLIALKDIEEWEGVERLVKDYLELQEQLGGKNKLTHRKVEDLTNDRYPVFTFGKEGDVWKGNFLSNKPEFARLINIELEAETDTDLLEKAKKELMLFSDRLLIFAERGKLIEDKEEDDAKD